MRKLKLVVLGFTLAIAGFNIAGCNHDNPVKIPRPETTVSDTQQLDSTLDPRQARIFQRNSPEELIPDLAQHFKSPAANLNRESMDPRRSSVNSITSDGRTDSKNKPALPWPATIPDHLVAHASWETPTSLLDNSNGPNYLRATPRSDEESIPMQTVFENRLRKRQQRALRVNSTQTLDWHPVSEQSKIDNRHQNSLDITYPRKPLFENATIETDDDDSFFQYTSFYVEDQDQEDGEFVQEPRDDSTLTGNTGVQWPEAAPRMEISGLPSFPDPMNQVPVTDMGMEVSDPILFDPGQTLGPNSPLEAADISYGSFVCNNCAESGCSKCGVLGTSFDEFAECQSCGPDGCFDNADVTSRFASCGSVSQARRYLIFDAIYLDRYDGTIAVSNFGGLNNFEDDLLGARITLGRREDAANGRELVYFGSAKMSQSSLVTDALARITVGGFPGAGDTFGPETTAFRNAVEQGQAKQTMFQSLEFNKIEWGWDVVRTFVGLRYIYVQDDYQLASENSFGETGLFELTTLNNLFGLQTGYELFYDVGRRFSGSTVGKIGLFANPNEVKTRLFNAGAQFLELNDTNTAFSGAIEMGLQGQFKITQRARLRFGYNAFFLSQVAGTSDNIPTSINPTTGSDTSDSGQMFFHGISLGFEVFR